MKKIILPSGMRLLLEQSRSFLSREDVRFYPADAAGDILRVHRAEKADLIILEFSSTGTGTKGFCATIREDGDLRSVSIIVVCDDTYPAREAAGQCRANAVLTRPLSAGVLADKAGELLSIAPRREYRVLLSISTLGLHGASPFFCRSQNISASGMLIETEKPLATGDRVECLFFVPPAVKVHTDAEVVRSIPQARGFGPMGYGIRFRDLAPDDRRAIASFVTSSMRRTGPGEAND